ncbi:MAG TPA: exosome complex exonuclease Rrp41 [Candidatus Nanoarchaeia archaeon]|nr:exosome complex exonuclease Rrp41 [Candidatus Nanoarchaeia archaeon]
MTRTDGRKPDQLREMEAKVGVIPRADGSAMFKIGNTIAYAAVYGPRALHPKFLQNPERGVLRCNYNMLSFSGKGNRVRPGPSRRSREISMLTEKALRPVLDLKAYPNAVIDVFVELLQTDAGTRCAGICAAAMALADAGIPMKDLISALSVGYEKDKLLIDINSDEDCGGATDIPLAIMPLTGKITLLQLDGDVNVKQLQEAVKAAKKGCMEIYKVQQKALKEKYGG